MESEKLEDLLLLSLSASKGQRERSEVLDVGVTRDKNLREVIVKYSGDIDGLQIPGMEIQKLLAGYAIVKLPEDQIGALVAAREIEYVEMPKNLPTGLYEAKRVSCILPLLSQGDEGAGRKPGRGAGACAEHRPLRTWNSGGGDCCREQSKSPAEGRCAGRGAVGREAFPKTEWLSTYDAADERSVLVAFQSCPNRAAARHQHQLRKLLRTA